MVKTHANKSVKRSVDVTIGEEGVASAYDNGLSLCGVAGETELSLAWRKRLYVTAG